MSLAYPPARPLRPAGARPAGWELAALAGALAAYNVALNHVPFPEWSYVPANLALATGVALLARRRWGLAASDLGVTRASVRPGLLVAGAVTAVVALALAAAPALVWAEPLLSDQRAAGVGGATLAYTVLVRIPLGTALPEELLFRGVLLGAYAHRTTRLRAMIASSAAFGLWHVGPGLTVLQVNRPGLGLGATVGLAAVVVASTAVAGVLFCLLRHWGRGLLAPVAVHAAINGLSLLAAVRFQAA